MYYAIFAGILVTAETRTELFRKLRELEGGM